MAIADNLALCVAAMASPINRSFGAAVSLVLLAYARMRMRAGCCPRNTVGAAGCACAPAYAPDAHVNNFVFVF